MTRYLAASMSVLLRRPVGEAYRLPQTPRPPPPSIRSKRFPKKKSAAPRSNAREQALVETVIGIQQMRGSKEWGPEEMEKALSSEALTSTVMQRYHVYVACRRDLGAKFGKFSTAQ